MLAMVLKLTTITNIKNRRERGERGGKKFHRDRSIYSSNQKIIPTGCRDVAVLRLLAISATTSKIPAQKHPS